MVEFCFVCVKLALLVLLKYDHLDVQYEQANFELGLTLRSVLNQYKYFILLLSEISIAS